MHGQINGMTKMTDIHNDKECLWNNKQFLWLAIGTALCPFLGIFLILFLLLPFFPTKHLFKHRLEYIQTFGLITGVSFFGYFVLSFVTSFFVKN